MTNEIAEPVLSNAKDLPRNDENKYKMKSIKDINLKNKNILLRTDFNVTLNPAGKIIDNIRIKASLATIKYLLDAGVKKITIVSHLGRPIVRIKEKISNIIAGNQALTMRPIAQNLASLLKLQEKEILCRFCDGFPLPIYQLSDKIFLLENIRFLPEEEQNGDGLSRQLAKLAQVFINDAFGASHRAHASIVGVSKYLPSYSGLLIEKEIDNLSKLLSKPPKPFVLVLGGAKTHEKMKVLANLIKKVDKILLGGVMANTFLVSRHVDVRNSVYDREDMDLADDLYTRAAGKFYLPTDLVWQGTRIVDIGKTTIEQYKKLIFRAKTIFLNGTMGLTSLGSYKYAVGTHAIIKAIAESPSKEKIICGGDTIAEVDRLKLVKKMSFVSTGGGAALQFMAGEKLPGVEALG